MKLLGLLALGSVLLYLWSKRIPRQGERVSDETLARLRCLEGGDPETFDSDNVTRRSLRLIETPKGEPSAPKAYTRTVEG